MQYTVKEDLQELTDEAGAKLLTSAMAEPEPIVPPTSYGPQAQAMTSATERRGGRTAEQWTEHVIAADRLAAGNWVPDQVDTRSRDQTILENELRRQRASAAASATAATSAAAPVHVVVQETPPVCTSCMDRPVETICIPCGHISMCLQCAGRHFECETSLVRCPICRDDGALFRIHFP